MDLKNKRPFRNPTDKDNEKNRQISTPRRDRTGNRDNLFDKGPDPDLYKDADREYDKELDDDLLDDNLVDPEVDEYDDMEIDLDVEIDRELNKPGGIDPARSEASRYNEEELLEDDNQVNDSGSVREHGDFREGDSDSEYPAHEDEKNVYRDQKDDDHRVVN